MAIKKPVKKRRVTSKRVKAKPLNGIAARRSTKAGTSPWDQYAGMFAGDPVFESVMKNVAEKRKQRRLNPDIP
jgi:hypothetical protein